MELVLHQLTKCFMSCIADKKILTPLLNKALEHSMYEIQEKILDSTVRHSVVLKYCPPISYKKYFLRTLIDILESTNNEISEDLLVAYTDVLKLDSSITKVHYYSYILNDGLIVTLEENSSFASNGTTGLRTWEAAKYFADWCFENTDVFANKKVLELGCGIGLLGHCILKTCRPSSYMFSDHSEHVLAQLLRNVELNRLTLGDTSVETLQFDWNSPSSEDFEKLKPDLIVATDILYDPSDIPNIVSTLKSFFENGTKACYITSTIRNENTDKIFADALCSYGLARENITSVKKSIFLYDDLHQFKLYKITL